jgi:hypothetical protein
MSQGKIDPDRTEIINSNVKFLKDNQVQLENLADHEDEKILVKKIWQPLQNPSGKSNKKQMRRKMT